MNGKQFLYTFFGVGCVVTTANLTRTGIVGPATLTLTLIPLLGMAGLLFFDLVEWVRSRAPQDSPYGEAYWEEKSRRRRRRDRSRSRQEGRAARHLPGE